MTQRRILKRDASSGRLTEGQATDTYFSADPAVSSDLATKNYVDTHTGAPAGTTVTTASGSYTAGQRQTFSLTMAKSFQAWLVTEASNNKFRLQLYQTSAARTADASRPYSVPLQLGTQHGCILDLYIDQVNAVTPWDLSPAITGSNNDGTQATTIYAAVTNIDTSTKTLAVTISYVALES